MSFSVSEFTKELKELRISKQNIALAADISPSCVSRYLSGLKRPPDRIIRRFNLVFGLIRSMGAFSFSRKNIRWLHYRIAEMEASVVESSRPSPKENVPTAQHRNQCVAN